MRIVCLVLLVVRVSAATPDPLLSASHYYYAKHDYRQALELSTQVLSKNPEDIAALLRVAELKLLFEGRAATRDVIQKYLEDYGARVGIENRRRVKQHLATLQSRFLTDAGQSHYLQALPKFRRKDFAGALALFDLAATEDRGNIEVLRLKAKCEKELGYHDRQYETLKSAYALSPYEQDIVEDLVEGHLNLRAYPKVVETLEGDPDLSDTLRLKVALVVAMTEMGSMKEGEIRLRGLMDSPQAAQQLPILYLVSAKSLVNRNRLLAIHTLQKFIDESSVQPKESWDPFHLSERTEEAKGIISSLSEKTS